MKIVVCDDNTEDLEKIRELLTRYMESNEAVQAETEYYTDSVELYQKIQKERQGDIYILDMIMARKTGIDIGALLRRTNKKSIIIYITSSDDFALEAYGVHAVRYILKPVREELFKEALDYAVSDIFREDREEVYSVKTREGILALPYSNIAYIESNSRMLQIHLTDEKVIKSIFIRRSFDEEIEPLTKDPRFLRVHKSFLVNMYQVYRLMQGSVIMNSGVSIPVSKARAVEVKKEYLTFISEQYR